MYKNDAFGFPI